MFTEFYHDLEVLEMIQFFFGSEVTKEYNSLQKRKYYRKGQAFMNSLPEKYYNQLSGSLADPFYKDSNHDVVKAIEYLTDPLAGVQEPTLA